MLATGRRLLDLLRPHRAMVAVSVCCRVVNQGLGVVVPTLAAVMVVDVVEGEVRWSGLWALVGLAIGKGIFRYLEQLTGHSVAFRLLAELRGRVFGWLERSEPAEVEQLAAGDLVSRVSSDIDMVEPFYAHTIAPLFAAVIVPMLAVAGLAIWVSPEVALVIGMGALAYLLVVPWLGARSAARTGDRRRGHVGAMAGLVGELVQGAPEIAVLGASARMVNKTGEVDSAMSAGRGELARTAALRSGVGMLVYGATVVGAVVTATSGPIEASLVAVSVVVAWTVFTPLRALEQVVPDTEQSLAAAARLFEIEDLPEQMSGAARSNGSGEVVIASVSVAGSHRDRLEDVSAAIAPGTVVGVAGPSGSGKSSLVGTIARMVDPDRGEVTVAGHRVEELSRNELSRAVAIVTQRPDLFTGTIASNLRIAAPEASDDQLWEVLGAVDLLEVVEGLPNRLESEVGELGKGLSGGQVQRLAIARALLRNPSVLILDEATSQLDRATERVVLESVLARSGDTTVVLVAHRLETLVEADQILVLDEGRLVESGTHERLIAAGGVYAGLWARHLDVIDSEPVSR